MNNRKADVARAEIRAVLEPIKQTMLNEIGKVHAEIRGGTEAIGAISRHQKEQHELITQLLQMVQQLDARVTRLELQAITEPIH